MKLISYVTGANDDAHCNVAVLDLGPEDVLTLQLLRDEYRRIKAQRDSLYCLELFDYGCQYGSGAGKYDGPADGDGWSRLPDDWQWQEDESAKVAAPTVRIVAEGVTWCAESNYSDDCFETPLLLWEQVESIARGQCPFPPAAGR